MKTSAKVGAGARVETVVFLVSLVVLAHEIVLLRLFALAQWAHVGYLVVGVALVGFGAAGVFIALGGNRIVAHARGVIAAGAILFAFAQQASYLLFHWFGFNTLELARDGREVVRLAIVTAVLAVTFFFGAIVIATALASAGKRVGRLYAMNLFGSACGALAGVGLYAHRAAAFAALIMGVLALGASVFRRRGGALAGCGLSLMFLGLVAAGVPGPRISEYKDLSQLLLRKDARRLATVQSVLAQIDVIDPGIMPLRNAPGLSMLSPEKIPYQLALTRDGSLAGTLTDFASREELAFLDWTPAAMAFRNGQGKSLAILGIGAGYEALYGRYYDLDLRAASEPDGRLVRFLRKRFARLYKSSIGATEVTTTSARKFAESARGREEFDVVVLAPAGGGGDLPGLSATQASFDHTVEAYRRFMHLLREGGILSITVPAEDPPRTGIRVLATLARAAREEGGQSPGDHIVSIRGGLDVITLLYRNTPWQEKELADIRDFAAERAFDLVWLADMRQEEAGRFMQYTDRRKGESTPRAKYYEAARAILRGDADHFFDTYPFGVAPVTDDRPFFNHHFKWATLEQIIAMGPLGTAYLEFGYVLAAAFLAVAAVIALIGTLLPALVCAGRARVKEWAAPIGYFLAIGLAYMMIEMTVMFRIERAVGHPVLAMATTIAGFLFWSGLGSLASDALANRKRTIQIAGTASAILAGSSIVTLGADLSLGLAPALACATVFLGLAPAAFAMGMMFPSGLALFAGGNKAFLAWCYGANGFASVLAGSGTVLLAMEIGMRWTLAAAGLLYLAAVGIACARRGAREAVG